MQYKVITLDNLEEATAQEVFNHVVNHLVTQKIRSFNGSVCRNRMPAAAGQILRCAAGSLITDEQYMRLEHKEGSWYEMVANNNLTVCHRALIESLQIEHDSTCEEFTPEYFDDVAEQYGLEKFPR
jgi:hypothetical protein